MDEAGLPRSLGQVLCTNVAVLHYYAVVGDQYDRKM